MAEEEQMTVKVDLSKVLSPRLAVYLLGTIPGMFFEASVVIGAPETAGSILTKIEHIFSSQPYAPLPPYIILICFIASGFVLGNVFVQLAWLVELLLSSAYWAWQSGIRITFGSYTFYKWLAKIQQPPAKRGLLVSLYSRAVFAARAPKRYGKAQPVMRCLDVATKQLLKRRYSIDVLDSLPPTGEELHVWYSVIGKPPRRITEGIPTARTSLGFGLAGFLALLFVPNLCRWYFWGVCSVPALSGLYLTWNLVRWRTDPVLLNFLRLQSVLLDLAEIGEPTPARADGEE